MKYGYTVYWIRVRIATQCPLSTNYERGRPLERYYRNNTQCHSRCDTIKTSHFANAIGTFTRSILSRAGRLTTNKPKKTPKNKNKKTIKQTLKFVPYLYDIYLPFPDIEQVKRNILDNLPELLDEINIDSLQTPFLSTGVLTREELDALRSSSESLRTENLQFVKLVLHKGAEAIRVFLGSLENSRGESELCRRLTKQTDTEDTCEGIRLTGRCYF